MIQYELLQDFNTPENCKKKGTIGTEGSTKGVFFFPYGLDLKDSVTFTIGYMERNPTWFKRIEMKNCGMCGGPEIEIRGRFPKEPPRMVCPTCAQERLDQINDISSRHYGVACKAQKL